jgi:segregation and condensation protein B
VLFMVDPSSPEFSESQGISLNELTQAYAQAMGSDATPEEQGTAAAAPVPSGDSAGDSPRETLPFAAVEGAEDDGEGDSDGVPVSPMTVVETLLFVGSIDSQPMETARAAELMRGVTPGDVAQLIEELNARYRSNGCPYKIVGDGAGYRMTLRRAFHPVQNKFYGKVREARLSQAAVDTLAIVAYRQPLTSEQVTQLRGTPSGHLLTQLVRRRLLEVERVEGSRQVLYRTSERFLELFGLDSLEDLPDSE